MFGLFPKGRDAKEPHEYMKLHIYRKGEAALGLGTGPIRRIGLELTKEKERVS